MSRAGALPGFGRSVVTVHRLVFGTVTTRGRLVALGALGSVGVLVGLGLGIADRGDALVNGTNLVNSFGLSLFTPVATLVLAAAALGDPVDDGTLIYLWARPVARWWLALGAWTATLAAAVPVVLVPLVLAALVSGGGGSLVWGTALAAGLGVLAYSSLFVLLGLWVRRALVWGLAYVLLWEGFVASAGANAARLAVRAYTRSILSGATGVELRLGRISWPFAVGVPLVVALGAFALTVLRLRRTEVA